MAYIEEMLRQQYIEEATRTGRPYQERAAFYHSRGCITADVVDEGAGYAFAVFNSGQSIEFFSYAIGDTITLGAETRRANKADTNLLKARETVGNEAFAVLEAGLQAKGTRVQCVAGDLPAIVSSKVIQAMQGAKLLHDPEALFVPRVVSSPEMLENTILSALQGELAAQLVYAGGDNRELGSVAMLGQAGRSSYLRARGSAEGDGARELPEGFLWNSEGRDEMMSARIELMNDIIIPIGLRTPVATPISLTHIYIDVEFQLIGTAFSFESENR